MIGRGGHSNIYKDVETGNMFVISTWFGTLICVDAKCDGDGYRDAPDVVDLQLGGFLFSGQILEQMSYITEPTTADELRAYEQLWRRPWSSNVALMNTESLSA